MEKVIIERPESLTDQKCVRMHKRFSLDIELAAVKLLEASLKLNQTANTLGILLIYSDTN